MSDINHKSENINPKKCQLASFRERLLAFVIDNIILSFAISPLLMLVFGEKSFTNEQLQAILQTQGILGLFSIEEIIISNILAMSVTIFFWVRFGGTPVKRFLGMRIVDAKTGKDLKTSQAALRYVGYWVSYIPLGLGFLWIIFDKNNQALHDKIAGTVVIKDKYRAKYPQRQESNCDDTNDEDDSFIA